jgi:hypothetical protein
MPIVIQGAIAIGGNIQIGPAATVPGGQSTAPAAQNLAANTGPLGFFYRTNNAQFALIQPGWTVDQLPGAVVVSSTTDPADQYSTTVEITGGVFVNGNYYTFRGV